MQTLSVSTVARNVWCIYMYALLYPQDGLTLLHNYTASELNRQVNIVLEQLMQHAQSNQRVTSTKKNGVDFT